MRDCSQSKMNNLLRLFHLGGGQDEHLEGGDALPKTRNRLSFSEISSESRPLSGLSGWMNVAKNAFHQGGSPKHKENETKDGMKDDLSATSYNENIVTDVEDDEEVTSTASWVAVPVGSSLAGAVPTTTTITTTREHKSSDSARGVGDDDAQNTALEKVQTASLQLSSDQALFLQDEELQVRVAMALSVQDDPEAAAIETAKDLSLGSELSLSNSTAEVLAYRYWKYNALGYDDKVLDGFYDVYGVASDTVSETMPALVDLQEAPVSEKITWEVILVNRETDKDLVELEQRAISIAGGPKGIPASGLKRSGGLAHKIAALVAEKMGGRVIDEGLLHKRWRTSSMELRVSSKNVVLPLGHLQVGLARHRALLFKVLADAVGIPCQLVKGKPYIGSDEGAVNIIKVDAGREYMIDLMGAPGTLLPSDVCGNVSSYSFHNKAQDCPGPGHMSAMDGDVHVVAKGGKDMASPDKAEGKRVERHQSDLTEPGLGLHALPKGSSGPSHGRSPSWTEGISSPAIRDMKVKDVSQYMMDAAKENPGLAQKLHDVLLDSGVAAPPNLFTEISPKHFQGQGNEESKVLDERDVDRAVKGKAVRTNEKSSVGPGRPPLPVGPPYSPNSEEGNRERLLRLKSVEGLGERHPLDPSGLNASPVSSPSSSASAGAAVTQSSSSVLPTSSAVSLLQENFPPQVLKRVPVAAAAAAATAAVVASSIVVVAAKSEYVEDPTLEVPIAAAATATAAVVVATSVVAGKRLDLPAPEPNKRESLEKADSKDASLRLNKGEAHVTFAEENGSDSQAGGSGGGGGADKFPKENRVSDKWSGSLSAKSDQVLEDVLEWEIRWEELVVGERIGLGSYGEVYHGEWHGTEVAVKKFLDQDISGDALDEFRSEIQLMKRMRHPNVVLFMGAVMRAPNLSIVTEFLPRGSLYRWIHRCNNQLDDRRRMHMALDVARGMNYLHNSTPVIVHRDLKSPNLLVDKNWVVKVCDFGLSRMKHNTFLSSKSTAGTPEWMAPEVLRNEPSNEKCDVFSFGVILWELATLQQPWAGMNPMQVVGAVGFQQRTLDIPSDMDPDVVNIIRLCWQSDPAARPSFAEIMAALKMLQRPLTHAQTTIA